MYNEAVISADDFVENTAPRLPICFCLDFSYSMHELYANENNEKVRRSEEIFVKDGKKYRKVFGKGLKTKDDELKEAVQSFLDAIRNDVQATASAEISIISFNDKVKFITESMNVTEIDKIEYPDPDGDSHMYEGILHALDLLEERKERYKSEGIQYFQPWLVLVTDGKPEGDTETNKSQAETRLQDLRKQHKLNIFPICIEPENKSDGAIALANLVPGLPALKLDVGDFSRFFEFMSQSAVAQSSSACVEVTEEKDLISGITLEGVMQAKLKGTSFTKTSSGRIEVKNLRDLFPEADSWSDSVDY